MSIILGVQDLSSLTGVSPQYIRRLAKNGKLPADIFTNTKNRQEYAFSLAAQPKDIQEKYYARQRAELAAPADAFVRRRSQSV